MALLIIELDKRIGNAKAWRDSFKEQIPDLEIRIWPEAGNPADIEYLAFMQPDVDPLPAFPNLKARFSRSAGVGASINNPNLPGSTLGECDTAAGDTMIAAADSTA